jgi:hypothetical protein
MLKYRGSVVEKFGVTFGLIGAALGGITVAAHRLDASGACSASGCSSSNGCCWGWPYYICIDQGATLTAGGHTFTCT